MAALDGESDCESASREANTETFASAIEATAAAGNGPLANSLEALQISSPSFDVLAIPPESLVVTFSQTLYELAVRRQGLQDELSVADIECFVRCTSRFYKSQNPFHNFHHACSVTQAVCCLVSDLAVFSPRERLLLCLIALCHDAGHLGLSNRYLAQRFASEAQSQDPKTSPPSSVEESKSVGETCRRDADEDSAYAGPSTQAEREAEDGKATVAAATAAMQDPLSDPREVVSRNGVLSTMEKHHVKIAHKIFRHHPVLLRAVSRRDHENGAANAADAADDVDADSDDDMDDAGMQEISAFVLVTILCTDLAVHDTLLNDLARGNEGETSLRAKLRLAALIMHCADLSNTSRPFEVNYEWSFRLDEERRLLEGGEAPAAIELPSVSKFARGEVGFIERFIEPSWVQLAESSEALEKAVAPWLRMLRTNLAEWKKLAAQDKVLSNFVKERRRRSISSLGARSSSSNGSDYDDLASADSKESTHCDVTCACAESPEACTCEDTRSLQLACTRSFIMRTPASQICCTILEKERSSPRGSRPSQIA